MNSTFKLGKQDPTEHPALLLSRFLDLETVLPGVPAAFTNQALIPEARLTALGNTTAGDCVIAWILNNVRVDLASVRRPWDLFTSELALQIYSQWTGYVEGDESTDQGTNILDAARRWHQQGVPDVNGAMHKLTDFALLHTRRQSHQHELIKAGASLFGAVGLGFALPESAIEQTKVGRPWDVVPGSKRAGGHQVTCVGYGNGLYIVITWGQYQLVTERFVTEYMDEGVVPITPDMLNANGLNEENLNLTQLRVELKRL